MIAVRVACGVRKRAGCAVCPWRTVDSESVHWCDKLKALSYERSSEDFAHRVEVVTRSRTIRGLMICGLHRAGEVGGSTDSQRVDAVGSIAHDFGISFSSVSCKSDEWYRTISWSRSGLKIHGEWTVVVDIVSAS